MTGTVITPEDIITAGRAISLTSTVVAEWAGRGTPKQREYLHEFLTAEHASRTHARHARLLTAARLPARKSLDGYDWTAIRFPDGYGRDQLATLEFLQHAGDLVFYGDVGTGKTHLASALVAAACEQGIPARFHTTASLVAQLRRAKTPTGSIKNSPPSPATSSSRSMSSATSPSTPKAPGCCSKSSPTPTRNAASS